MMYKLGDMHGIRPIIGDLDPFAYRVTTSLIIFILFDLIIFEN